MPWDSCSITREMEMLGRLCRRVWYLLNRRRLERELEREMAAHRAEMSDPRRFRGTLRLREQSDDVWGWEWLDNAWRDLRYGARQLRRTPAFTLAAALTLALGIAANAAGFALLKASLFDDLRVSEPAALRRLEWNGGRGFSEEAFEHLRAHGTGFSDLTCIASSRFTLAHDGTHESLATLQVAGAFFQTFRITAALGRPLTASDDQAGATPVAVVGHEFWQRAFAGASSAIGAEVAVDGMPVTIVGVMPAGFTTGRGRRPFDLIMPLAASPDVNRGDRTADPRRCSIVVRLAPGRSEEATRQQSEKLLRWSGSRLPSGAGRAVPLERGRLRFVRTGRGIDEMSPRELQDNLPAMLGGAFLILTVLLVPCANVAAMLLARAITRRPEIVARMALGASRARLIRQLLTEGALLAALAGMAGLLIAWVVTSSLDDWPSFDVSVLGITFALCAIATLAFALAPALNATTGDLATAVRESSAGTPGRRRGAPGAVLVALQVLVSCVLLAAAGLQATALIASARVTADHPERVLFFDVKLSQDARLGGYVEGALQRLSRMTGIVSSAAASEARPVSACESRVDRAWREVPAWVAPISPGYLATMNLRLKQGRDVAWTDSATGEGVVLLNETMARSLFGPVTPVGQRLPLGACTRVGQRPVAGIDGLHESPGIVGVVADMRGVNSSEPAEIVPTIYVPYAQLRKDVSGTMTFTVRSAGSALPLVKAIRDAMAQTPGVAVGGMETQAQRLERRFAGVRLLTMLYLLLGVLAGAQAAFGLYGTISQFVNRRRAEIALRIVLGARLPDILRMILRQTLKPVVAGVLLGVACSPLVAQVMRAARVITGASWGELLAISLVVSLLTVPAFAAATVPIRRVMRVAPAASLREE